MLTSKDSKIINSNETVTIETVNDIIPVVSNGNIWIPAYHFNVTNPVQDICNPGDTITVIRNCETPYISEKIPFFVDSNTNNSYSPMHLLSCNEFLQCASYIEESVESAVIDAFGWTKNGSTEKDCVHVRLLNRLANTSFWVDICFIEKFCRTQSNNNNSNNNRRFSHHKQHQHQHQINKQIKCHKTIKFN